MIDLKSCNLTIHLQKEGQEEHIKAISSSKSDHVSSAQNHHTGFYPTRNACKSPFHDPPLTNQAYSCFRTFALTRGFLPIYTWLELSTFFFFCSENMFFMWPCLTTLFKTYLPLACGTLISVFCFIVPIAHNTTWHKVHFSIYLLSFSLWLKYKFHKLRDYHLFFHCLSPHV